MIYQTSPELEENFSRVFKRYEGFLKTLPTNNTVKLILRIYVIKATIFVANSINQNCDPYLTYKIGDKLFDDRRGSLCNNTLEPVFGRFNIKYEMKLQKVAIKLNSLQWRKLG